MTDYFHDSYFSMHTRFEVVWWGTDKQKSTAIFSQLTSILDWVELKLSCHDVKSELFRLNRFAGSKEILVSDYLFHVLKTVETFRKKTFGCFDPDFSNPFSEKSEAELLEFDEDSKSIRFNNPQTKLDLGAVGKGFALEKIKDEILDKNLDHAFTSFGESSILTRGRHPNGDHWPLGLCDMYQPEQNLYSVKLTDHAVSISSTKKKGANEKSGDFHVYNPHNGQILEQDKMMLVKANSPIEAEVLSTALLVADTDVQQKILANFEIDEAVQITYQNKSPKIRRLL